MRILPWLALILLTGCATLEETGINEYAYEEIDGVLTETTSPEIERHPKFSDEMKKTYELLGTTGGGSGWAIDSRHIVTAKHVVKDNLLLAIRNCENELFFFESITLSPDADLALITMMDDVIPFPVATEIPNPDDVLVAFGWPALVHVAKSHGWFFGWASPDFMAVDMTIISGFSGGPVLNAAGEVVGMVTATSDNTIGRSVGFVLSIDVILENLNELGYINTSTEGSPPS